MVAKNLDAASYRNLWTDESAYEAIETAAHASDAGNYSILEITEGGDAAPVDHGASSPAYMAGINADLVIVGYGSDDHEGLPETSSDSDADHWIESWIRNYRAAGGDRKVSWLGFTKGEDFREMLPAIKAEARAEELREMKESAEEDRILAKEDGEVMDREEGITRDQYGFAVHGEACDCADGPDADEHGNCRVCGGHD